jgi:hypothetical protein
MSWKRTTVFGDTARRLRKEKVCSPQEKLCFPQGTVGYETTGPGFRRQARRQQAGPPLEPPRRVPR